MRVDGFGMNDTQTRVWEHVRLKMSLTNFESSTESYSELQEFRMNEKRREFPECEPDKESNGMAVFMDTKVLCADIFGNKEVYKYYFPMLRDSAFRMARTGKKQKSPDMHEVYYRVQETIDNFMEAERHHDESCTGAGLFKTVENKSLTGFDLSVKEELIHGVLFTK
jgi:neutral trehalase